MKWLWFLSGLVLIGVALLIVGAKENDNLITSVGGAFVGAAISAALANIDSREILNSIRNSIKADFRSEDGELKKFRGRWHVYHATSKHEKPIWSHALTDFRNTSFPGSLFSKIYLLDLSGKKKRYEITAGIRDTSFVMLIKGAGEPCTVAVYPFVGKRYGDEHCGLWLHETWDNVATVSPTIISAEPLLELTKAGDITDKEGMAKLNKFWAGNFKMEILPTVMPQINTKSNPEACAAVRGEIKSHAE